MAGDALWINASAGAPSYTASELRRAFAALLSPKGTAGTNRFSAVDGIRVGSGVVTSLAGSTITVKAHAFVISPDLSSTQGPYVGQLPADETHTLTAAHATLARTDLVYDQISDHDEDASGARTATSGYLAGTPGGGAPSLPARSFEIARIAVPPSGGGSATVTERGSFTVAAGGVLPVRDAADLPAHYAGRVAYQTDTGALKVSNGTTWTDAAVLGQLGAWTAFTLTTGGSNGVTIGNATQDNKYQLIAPKTAAFRIALAFGSSSAVSGTIQLGPLPFTVQGTDQIASLMCRDDSATQRWGGAAWLQGTQAFRLIAADAAGGANTTTPFNWAQNDVIQIQGVVEIT